MRGVRVKEGKDLRKWFAVWISVLALLMGGQTVLAAETADFMMPFPDTSDSDAPAPEEIPKLQKVTLKNVACKKGRQITITWKKAEGSGYKVYRSKKKKGNYKLIATIEGAENHKYVDKRRTGGKTYYYKVRAFQELNGKNYQGPLSKAGKKTVPKIAISIGHGRSRYGTIYDPGAVFGGYHEFNLAKEIGKYAWTYYRKNCGGECRLINYDGSKGLLARVQMLQDSSYTLVCEIHLNAVGGSGTEVYYCRRDMRSQPYAAEIVSQLSRTLGIPNRGALQWLEPSGVDHLTFLRETKSPAILVETAFIDNVSDLSKVNNAAGQKRAGEAIAKAIGTVTARTVK